MKKNYSEFLVDKLASWAELGIKNDHWDRLLIAISPVMIKEIRKAVKEKEIVK